MTASAVPHLKHREFASLALVQWLALLTMAVDHLGAVGLLGEWSRGVGRFALPAFVVMIAYNAWHTRSPSKMCTRVLFLALVSQPLWWLSVGSPGRLSIMVTLLVVVALVWSIRSAQWGVAGFILASFVVVSPYVEYGALPLLLVPLGIVRRGELWPVAVFLAFLWAVLQYQANSFYLVFALVAVGGVSLLIFHCVGLPRSPRWLSFWFYPAHLALLSLIKIAS